MSYITSNAKKSLSLILIAALLGASSCGGTESGKITDSSSPTDESTDTTAPVEKTYPFYDGVDLGGETFVVWNVMPNLWNMHCAIAPEEVDGETVNDAIYNRNAKVEAKMNYTLKEVNAEYDKMATELDTLVMSGDSTYDAVYMPMFTAGSGLSQGYYRALDEIDTIHLGDEWWDQIFLDATSIGGSHYFAMSNAHLMGWDGLWCLLFNENMMDDLGLDYPYQLVRDGKWTLDKLTEYCEAAANLNGDDSFKCSAEGNSTFGCVSFQHVPMKFLFGLGADFVTKDKNDMPVFDCGNRFIEACQKLAVFFGKSGVYLAASSDSAVDIYYQNFYEANRALFLGCELKTTGLLRNMNENFGIVPYPKLDENQADYRSTAVHQCAVFTIPVTSTHAEEIGQVFDALSYESDEMVLQPYFAVVVEQKGLRNQDSIDMLNIIKRTRSYDIGIAYQWVSTLEEQIRNKIYNGSADVASIIDSNKSKVQENIDKMLTTMNEAKG